MQKILLLQIKMVGLSAREGTDLVELPEDYTTTNGQQRKQQCHDDAILWIQDYLVLV